MIRQAWEMFGGKKELDQATFFRVIKNLGIDCTERVSKVLFEKFDADHSGMLDVYEFVRALMPADMTCATWNIEAEDRRDLVNSKMKRQSNLPEVLPPHLKEWRIPLAELERQVMAKLDQRVNTSTKQLGLRQAFRLFAKDGCSSISRNDWNKGLRQLGFVLNPQDAAALFDKYDRDADGRVSYKEFQQGLYPREAPDCIASTRPLARAHLHDPTPEFIGDDRRLHPDAAAAEVARQAEEHATIRLRSGPLYYNPLPTRREFTQQARLGPNTRHVTMTPPCGAGFMETIDHHYNSAINPSPKIYGAMAPPKTASMLAPPWASLQYQKQTKMRRSTRSRSTF